MGTTGEPQEGLLESVMRRVACLEIEVHGIEPHEANGEPSAHDLVSQLDHALHGQHTGVNISPKEKWEALLREIGLLVARTPMNYRDAVWSESDEAKRNQVR